MRLKPHFSSPILLVIALKISKLRYAALYALDYPATPHSWRRVSRTDTQSVMTRTLLPSAMNRQFGRRSVGSKPYPSFPGNNHFSVCQRNIPLLLAWDRNGVSPPNKITPCLPSWATKSDAGLPALSPSVEVQCRVRNLSTARWIHFEGGTNEAVTVSWRGSPSCSPLAREWQLRPSATRSSVGHI